MITNYAIIFLFRNKEEGYFIAGELLKRICKIEDGAQAILKSPPLLKRLNNLAEELSRKAGNDKRSAQLMHFFYFCLNS